MLERGIKKKYYSEEEVFQLNDQWHCYDAHSDLSRTKAKSIVDALNESLKSTNQQINESTHFIITLGTSWVYRHKKTGRLVANCHKVPQKEFTKELLSVNDIFSSIQNMVDLIRGAGSNAEIICTVSPVRHLKDGFSENLRSKAHLITAVHQASDDGLCQYFPSYELMMDELRDYRYYDRDMVHPNEIAIDYIWEKFKSVWIDPEAYPVMSEVDQIQKGLKHRPFNPESDQHKQFAKGLNERIIDLQKKYPSMKFDLSH